MKAQRFNYTISFCLLLLAILVNEHSAKGIQQQKYPNNISFVHVEESDDLPADFKNPPPSAKPWAYWWWLEGNISRTGILKDLKAMKNVGIGGAIIFDAGSSSYSNVRKTKSGPPFMSNAWQDLFVYAVKTADSLDLGISMNIGSGWNDGGPWVTPDMAAKEIAWSKEIVEGPRLLEKKLKISDNVFRYTDTSEPYFKQVAVLAVKLNLSSQPVPPLKHLDLKAVHQLMDFKSKNENGYNWEIYLQDTLQHHPEYDAKLDNVFNITEYVNKSGRISWKVPEGKYAIIRFGYTGTGARVSTHSPGGGGLAIDYMSAEAMDLQFNHTVGKLLEKIGAYAGKSFRFVHDDSWELGAANWTSGFIEAFKEHHGYNPVPYLPVIAGMVIERREVSNRFLYDYRRTIADLIAKNHYARFRTLAHQNNLGLHPEGGGPHPAPIDGLKNLGINDIPMGEFWAKAKTHRVKDYERIFVKQAASAAHIYGKKLVQAEGPTSIGPHWEVDPWHLKPTIDRVFCEGLNRMVFHTFTHSPEEAGKPGNEYFAGTHFNPNITWWNQAPAFVDYISRTQVLLQQGKFVGDVCFYYGDNVPNQVPLKNINPSLGEGYDYDVVNTEVILERMDVKNNKLYLPDGMKYEILVLPDRKAIPLDVLKKLEQMAKKGATIVGPRPSSIPGLKSYKQADAEVKAIAGNMWGNIDGDQIKEHTYGKGKIIWGKSLRSILQEKGIAPDFSYQSEHPDAFIDYIHRTTEEAEIYFIANRKEQEEHFEASFRVTDKIPQLWYPENGMMIPQSIYSIENGHINMPLHLEPFGSVFVVFRQPSPDDISIAPVSLNDHNIFPSDIKEFNILPRPLKNRKLAFHASGKYYFKDAGGKVSEINIDAIPDKQQLKDNWMVHFDPKWGGPDSIKFIDLMSWTEHEMEGIKYYSGTASYHKRFELNPKMAEGDYQIMLNLGDVYNLAEVIVNGENLGVLWKRPFKVDITDHVQAGENSLEIKVVNLWPNRIIGDQYLPKGKRYTQTNMTKFTKDYPLLKSGLLGPVNLSFYPVLEMNS